MRENDRERASDLDPSDNNSGDDSHLRDTIDRIISDNIARLRGELSPRRFSEEIGINAKQVEERGGGKPETLWKIARACGVPLWWIYVDRGDRPIPQELKELSDTKQKSPQPISPEEWDYLIALPEMLGRDFTYDAYYKALEMLRASSPKKTGPED